MVTGSAASEVRDPNHGFSHGPIGAAIMRRPDYLSGLKYNMPVFERYPRGSNLQEALARVCERHTGCVGISQTNWPSQLRDENGNCLDYQPDHWDTVMNIKGCFVGTWEEKVVGMADFLTTAHPIYPSGDRDSSVFYKGMSTHINERIKKAEMKGFDTIPIIRRLKEKFDQKFKIDWNYIVGA